MRLQKKVSTRGADVTGEIAWDGVLAIRLGRDHGDVAAIAGLVGKTFVANQLGVYPRRPYIAVRRAVGSSERQQRDGTLLRSRQ
ncbi:MAG: hypothetical protein ACRED2_01685 [Methylocella sp.]